MKNDRKVLNKAKSIHNKLGAWINYVTGLNQNSYSDRILESIIQEVGELSQLYNKNFSSSTQAQPSSKFNHINDCWDYLREAKNIEDLEARIKELPIWSGSWLVEFIKTHDEDNSDEYLITNCIDGMDVDDKETIYFEN